VRSTNTSLGNHQIVLGNVAFIRKENKAKDDTSGQRIQGGSRLFWFDIAQLLRPKIFSNAVPQVIIPLEKAMHNPNGKEVKPALPFIEAARVAAARPKRSSVGLSDTEVEVLLVPKMADRCAATALCWSAIYASRTCKCITCITKSQRFCCTSQMYVATCINVWY
jgi:hypothetical protein